jgi:hypothetical protein
LVGDLFPSEAELEVLDTISGKFLENDVCVRFPLTGFKQSPSVELLESSEKFSSLGMTCFSGETDSSTRKKTNGGYLQILLKGQECHFQQQFT